MKRSDHWLLFTISPYRTELSQRFEVSLNSLVPLAALSALQ